MTQENKKFRVSSALKDIIGRDLVTDEFVAVFELVKNAFDANAKKVDVIFDGLDTTNKTLVILDDGKGMDRKDFDEKWLFVAYSAKKEGTEDYRDKIISRRVHAGAKGIGRFSCDRLGKHLAIYSKRNGESPTIHRLEVHWEDFEKDMHKEFVKIPVSYSTTTTNPYNIKTGTALEITELRETWDRAKLLKLRHSLEKLINPNQGNDSKRFSINLIVPSERAADKEVPKDEPWNLVNGKVRNFLFEDLELKTTTISTEISTDGTKIRTRLEDRGKLIYDITEKNPYSIGNDKLHDIAIHLFAMNQAAKVLFTRYMGIRVIEYGSVFLYKNGFRIHPIGEVKGGDIFGLDRRKQQHGSSYLGTRDMLGRVEINGQNENFKETSSRDGGLIKNEYFEKLQGFFLDYALKRLERFAIDVIRYGAKSLGEEFDYDDIRHSEVFELIKALTRSDDIVDFSYDPKILDIFEEVSEQSLTSLLTNFRRIASDTGNELLESEAKKAEKRLKELQRAKEHAEANAQVAKAQAEQAEERAREEEERAKQAEAKAKEARAEVDEKTSQNLFLRSVVSQDVTNILSLHHHIGIAAGAIENYIRDTARRIKSGKPITADEFLSVLDKISYQAKKISSTTRFATKANFLLDATKIEGDLINFIEEYLFNICNGLIRTLDNAKPITFVLENKQLDKFETEYKPLEITIILDNLISNARKAHASKIEFSVSVDKDMLQIYVTDNGRGIKKDHLAKVFDLGFTTTNGSGLGLHHVVEILDTFGGKIHVTDGKGGGTMFKIDVPRI